jgi:hypothetical protein
MALLPGSFGGMHYFLLSLPTKDDAMGPKKISILLMAFCFAINLAVAGSAFGMELSGKVTETLNSGGYTYILLENENGKTWAAFPEAKVAAGDQVKLRPGMIMDNFTSKTLNRSFDQIYFCDGLAQ